MSAIWENSLPDEWEVLGREILEAAFEGDVNKIRRFESNTVKERLLDSFYVAPICALYQNAIEFGIDERLVDDRLDLNSVTLSRWPEIRSRINDWNQNPKSPDPRMFLGLLILGLRKEVPEIELPTNQLILSNAVRRTVGIIRSRECGKSFLMPRREEFCFIRYFFKHGGSPEFLHAPHIAFTTLSGKATLAKVIKISATLHSDLLQLGYEDVVRMLQNWAEPFVLLRIGLAAIWSHLDEVLE